MEVWGHRSAGFTSSIPTTLDVVDSQLAKARSLADRWAELTRKLELWVEIQELNDHGEMGYISCRFSVGIGLQLKRLRF